MLQFLAGTVLLLACLGGLHTHGQLQFGNAKLCCLMTNGYKWLRVHAYSVVEGKPSTCVCMLWLLCQVP